MAHWHFPFRFLPALILFIFITGCSRLARPKNSVSLAVVGDIMVHDPQIPAAWDNTCACHDFAPAFAHVSKYFNVDLAIGNLETTLVKNQQDYSGYPRFGAPESLAEALYLSGFDILATANNHSVDKGKKGIINTIRTLDKHSLTHTGTWYKNFRKRKQRILSVRRNRLDFAVINYTYGTNYIKVPAGARVNLINREDIERDIALARKSHDAVIVILHFGKEYNRFPDDFQKETVDHAFYAGADIVLGSHPHVLQPFRLTVSKDKYGMTKKRLVIYSLGNFISSQRHPHTDGGIIFRFNVAKKGNGLEFSNINYLPVWVYIETKKQKLDYRVVPINDWLSDRDNLKKRLPMSKSHERQMKLFYDETVRHLGSDFNSRN